MQHFSPACRAAHLGGVNTLAAAAILRSLTDADLERCKGFRNFSISQVLFILLLIFAIIATAGELIFDQVRFPVNTAPHIVGISNPLTHTTNAALLAHSLGA